MASCYYFLSGPIADNIFFNLSLTTCHLDFVMEFLRKCCVGRTTLKLINFIRNKQIFQNFAYLLKIYINILSEILAYFTVDSGMKLFFVALFFFISKKITQLNIFESPSKNIKNFNLREYSK